MSLNWNIEKVENHSELQEGEPWLITDALIWLTMAIGIREIKADNVEEVYARIHFVELVRGSMRNRAGKPLYIKREDIQRRIGLYTNVSTKTRKQFTDQVTKRFFEDNIRVTA